MTAVRQEPFTVGVVGGEGLIARYGELVLYAGANDEPAAALLAAAESVSGTADPAAALADELGPVAFGVAKAVPFGVVAPTSEGLVILLHGAVRVDIETPADQRSLSGKDSPSWVRVETRGPARKVGITASRLRSRTATPRTDLVKGVVPAGGFVLVPVSKVRTSERWAPAKGVASVRMPSPADSTTTSLPVASRAEVKETAAVAAAKTSLITPDGAVYPLDRAYVIGRAPLADDAVRTATASPIVIPYNPRISRVHAYVTVERGIVFVRDADTSAGTYIAGPDADDWTRIDTNRTRLTPGWSLRIGDWIATLHTD